MLKQRIFTGLALVLIAVVGLFFLPPLGFPIFITAVITMGAWEWANLANLSGYARYAYALMILMLAVASAFVPIHYMLVMSLLWWLLAFFLVLGYPEGKARWASTFKISVMGILILVPSLPSLMVLKQSADANFWILLFFFLVCCMDIGAYFTGRLFGTHQLAPQVSPGKTWEGVLGGLTLTTIVTLVFLLWSDKFELFSGQIGLFVLGCIGVALLSVLGDLVISMVKRQRGIKDSSQLLPGHGGILDRIDSLLAAGPVFALFILGFGW